MSGRIPIAGLLLLGLGSAAAAQSTGLDFCVLPMAPRCADHPDTFSTPALTKRCETEILAYVNVTVEYRKCLIGAGGAAYIRANKLIDAFNKKKWAPANGRRPARDGEKAAVR